MDITLIIYIVFAIVVLYVLLSYLAEVFLSESSYFQEKKKEQLIINDSNFKYDLYKRSAIIDAYSNDIIDTNVKYKDIIINIIDINNLSKYNLNRAIIDNINNTYSRYLLLEVKSSLTPLILQNLKRKIFDKKITYLEGSPFIDDNNNEYKFKMISDIQDYAKNNNLIIY